ncbi:MAG TPA: hypothetical protein VFP37_17480 [Steroidobacteraceae bacterium]|nr:hypothetical protein [Steroidobacteraceae bacterium]
MRRSFVLLLCLYCADATAASLTTSLVEGELALRIDDLSYPATLPAELQSGLTNRLYLRIALLDGPEVIRQRTVEISIRYDLWDESFTVSRSLDQGAGQTRRLTDLGQVHAYLGSLRLPRLFALGDLPTGRELVARVQVLLNPIGREKLRMIRKWVTENSTPEVSADSGVSNTNSLFNRIFEQYADGSDVAAVWRTEVTSAPFRAGALTNEPR